MNLEGRSFLDQKNVIGAITFSGRTSISLLFKMTHSLVFVYSDPIVGERFTRRISACFNIITQSTNSWESNEIINFGSHTCS